MPPTKRRRSSSAACSNALRITSRNAALARAEARLVERELDRARAEARADDPLVQILGRPGDEARVDGLGERVAHVRDAAGRRDDDDHDDGRLEQQHLRVPQRRRLQRRRRDEREQARHLREHLGRRLQRFRDLRVLARDAERELGPSRLRSGQERVDVEAVARLGGHAPGRGVRVREQAEALELGELVADGRRRDVEAGTLDERLRADGLAGGDVLLHHPPQDVALALRERICTDPW